MCAYVDLTIDSSFLALFYFLKLRKEGVTLRASFYEEMLTRTWRFGRWRTQGLISVDVADREQLWHCIKQPGLCV